MSEPSQQPKPIPARRLRGIATLARRLDRERKHIRAPSPDSNPPWGELCAWAARGDKYLEAIRTYPPEEIYRELLAEIDRLRAENAALRRPAPVEREASPSEFLAAFEEWAREWDRER